MKITRLIFSAFALATIALLPMSCSDDLDGELNKEIIAKLSATSTPIHFKTKKINSFKMAPGSSKWKDFDYSKWIGLSPAGYQEITFIDGKILTKLSLSSVEGPDPIAILWGKYIEHTHPQNIYIEDDFFINPSDNSITIRGLKYDLLKCESNEIVLSVITTYLRASDDGTYEEGKYKTRRYYSPYNDIDFSLENDHIFSNIPDAYDFMLECIKSTPDIEADIPLLEKYVESIHQHYEN